MLFDDPATAEVMMVSGGVISASVMSSESGAEVRVLPIKSEAKARTTRLELGALGGRTKEKETVVDPTGGTRLLTPDKEKASSVSYRTCDTPTASETATATVTVCNPLYAAPFVGPVMATVGAVRSATVIVMVEVAETKLPTSTDQADAVMVSPIVALVGTAKLKLRVSMARTEY